MLLHYAMGNNDMTRQMIISFLFCLDNKCLRRTDDGRDDILTLVDISTPSQSEALFNLPQGSVDCSPVNAGFYYLQRAGTWRYHRLGKHISIF